MKRDDLFAILPAITVLCLLSLYILWKILQLNHGFFVYTLDDPYIHMTVAQNLIKGHYGLNYGEISTPCSSILWPFLLVPMALSGKLYLWAPLLLNGIFAIFILLLIDQIMKLSTQYQSRNSALILRSIVSIVFIFSSNLIGLIFTGMEHCLQVLAAVSVIYGMAQLYSNGKISRIFTFALIFGPLIRYENISFSIAGILLLFVYRKYKTAVICLMLSLLGIFSFSFFLWTSDLPLLPASVLAKKTALSACGNSSGLIANILKSSVRNIEHPIGKGFTLLSLALLLLGFLNRKRKERFFLSTCFCIPIILHLFFGRFGWLNRYESYVLTASFLGFIWFLNSENNRPSARKKIIAMLTLFTLIFMLYISRNYLFDLPNLPIASHNIYTQQYQMHRIANKIKCNIGVNDIGYVAYDNPNYVLDFWGLASYEALKYRKNRSDSSWMEKVASEQDVELIMIYESWFPNNPPSWTKIAQLNCSGPLVSIKHKSVSIYSRNKAEIYFQKKVLSSMLPSIPEDAELILY